ncbi:MAG: FeoA family protein [Limisphaerales bacterium]|jgi:Fe2+ transport system protein FeoA|nr:FeoA family protein [Verrucomicrobiota bacterium]
MKMPTVNEGTTPGAGSPADAMPSNTMPGRGRCCRNHCKQFSLGDLPVGSSARVFSVQAPTAFASRLHSLGFVPGVPLRLLCRNGRGSLIVEILRSRLSLSLEAARAISVRPL